MANNSNKGFSKLAGVLQTRMSQVGDYKQSVCVETGEIMSGMKLKLSSQPEFILEKKDYSVCASLQMKLPCQEKHFFGEGDQVLVVWTFDGEPVIIDKILKANAEDVRIELECKKKCKHIEELEKKIDSLESKVNSL